MHRKRNVQSSASPTMMENVMICNNPSFIDPKTRATTTTEIRSQKTQRETYGYEPVDAGAHFEVGRRAVELAHLKHQYPVRAKKKHESAGCCETIGQKRMQKKQLNKQTRKLCNQRTNANKLRYTTSRQRLANIKEQSQSKQQTKLWNK